MIFPKYFKTKKHLLNALMFFAPLLKKETFLRIQERLLKLNYPRGTQFYSQGGQDIFVDLILNQKRDGYFIEIGANDGLLYSNSVFFERDRNWTGSVLNQTLSNSINW